MAILVDTVRGFRELMVDSMLKVAEFKPTTMYCADLLSRYLTETNKLSFINPDSEELEERNDLSILVHRIDIENKHPEIRSEICVKSADYVTFYAGFFGVSNVSPTRLGKGRVVRSTRDLCDHARFCYGVASRSSSFDERINIPELCVPVAKCELYEEMADTLPEIFDNLRRVRAQLY